MSAEVSGDRVVLYVGHYCVSSSEDFVQLVLSARVGKTGESPPISSCGRDYYFLPRNDGRHHPFDVPEVRRIDSPEMKSDHRVSPSSLIALLSFYFDRVLQLCDLPFGRVKAARHNSEDCPGCPLHEAGQFEAGTVEERDFHRRGVFSHYRQNELTKEGVV